MRAKFQTAIILSALLAAPVFASAQEVDRDRLEELTRQEAEEKKRAEQISNDRGVVQKEITSLRSRLVKMASELNALEKTSGELEARLIELQTEEAVIRKSIQSGKSGIQNLLAALQTIESNPPPALAVSPQDAANAARAGVLMTSLSTQLDTKTSALKVELSQLETLRDDIAVRQEELKENEEELRGKRAGIETTVGQKQQLEKKLGKNQDAAQKKADKLAAEANSLKDLITSLERGAADIEPRIKPEPGSDAAINPQTTNRPKSPTEPLVLPDGTTPFASAKGKVKAPLSGRLLKRYSKTHPGYSVKTKGRASVTAPYPARVEFSGPFKNFDNVVILNVGDGYFLLLTGLGQVYAKSGATVTAGEPLGLMPGGSQSELYLEVRKNGSTVNPSPWFGTAFAR